jgi:4-amino-4-deoxy-L-arabinose transferase-like glycosyltransferase
MRRSAEMPAPLIAAGLALLHLVLAAFALQPAPYIGGDNGAYVALAQSLAERGAYLELWDPALRPHTQYPPLFPLLLAAAMKAGVSTWVGFALVTVACSGAAVAASYLWMRRVSTPAIALAAGALLAVVPGPLVLAHEVLSDVPFWALALLALWAAVPCEEGRGRLGWAIAAAALAAAAYMTRSAGLPLIVALAASFALRRRWRELALLGGIAGAPAVLWWMRGRALGAAGYTAHLRYLDPYQPSMGTLDAAGWAGRIAKNLAHYLGEHLPVVLGGTEPLRVAAGSVLVVLALAGWARRLRGARAAELFVPLYAGLLLIWPATWSGERFLLPILPLLLVYAGETVRDGAATLRMRPRAVGVAAAVALAMVVLPGTSRHVREGVWCTRAYLDGHPLPCLTPVWHDLLAVPMMARGKLPPSAVVLSRKPTLFYALSGYPSRIYPPSADPDAFFRAAREAGAEWVLVDRVPDLAPIFLHPVLRARSGDFCLVPSLSLPNAALARIDPGGTPRANQRFRVCPLGTRPSHGGGVAR